MLNKTLIICCIWGIIALNGCRKLDDYDKIYSDGYSAEFAIPVLQTSATLQDFLFNLNDSTTISIGTDGLITLHYNGDVITKSGLDILNSIEAAGGIPPIPVTDTLVAAYFAPPNNLGIDIDFVTFKEGILLVSFKSKHADDVHVKLTIPSLTLNDLPFTKEYDIDYTGTTPIPGGSVESLIGYKLQTIEDSIRVHYEAIRSNGMKDTLSDFFVFPLNLKFGYSEGFWGQEIQDNPRDTIFIDFFKNWQQGNIYFQNPKVTVTAFNSFGFPSRIQTNVMNIITVNGNVLPLQSPFLNNVYFNYPSFDEVGQIKTTLFNFDNTNSNIAQIIGAGPVALDYDVDVLANPDGNLGTRGFITDSSIFKINMAVELPLYGTASNFAAQDTFDFDLCSVVGNSDAVSCSDVASAEFKIVTENQMPVGIGLQMYFVDADNAIIDSLLTDAQTFVEAATVDAQGYGINTAKKVIFAPLPIQRIGSLNRIKRIILKNTFSTYNQGQVPVRILNYQNLNIRMGMKVGIKR